jgi:hypothetical protein
VQPSGSSCRSAGRPSGIAWPTFFLRPRLFHTKRVRNPGEGVSWAYVQEAALLTRAMLSELGLESWVKTSGGKGLQVVVPLVPKLDSQVVKGFSQSVVQHMAKAIPQRFVAKSGPANRLGKIFIDTCATATRRRPRPRSQHGPGRGWASRYLT